MPAGIAAPALDLRRSRTLGELIADTISLFVRHAPVFWVVTLLVVGPVAVLLDGVWGRELAEGLEAESTPPQYWGSFAIFVLVIPPIVTAMHVRIVQRLAEGIEPTVPGAIREAAGRIAPAFATVTLYTLAVVVGLAALIAPGVWIAVRWYFGAQAAVVDGLGPAAALKRSGYVVGPEWGRCFGYLLAGSLVLSVATLVVMVPVGLIADALAGNVGFVAASALAQAAAISLSALFGTLLFFELRASRDPLA